VVKHRLFEPLWQALGFVEINTIMALKIPFKKTLSLF